MGSSWNTLLQLALVCATVLPASASMPWPDTRLAPDTALGARWVEIETDHGVLVAQETEVTMSQWYAVMGEGLPLDRTCQSVDCPAADITPLSMMVFANRLSDLEGFDRCYDIVGGEGDVALGRLRLPNSASIIPHCTGYRLPTRDEWAVLIQAEPLSHPDTPVEQLRRVGWVAQTPKDTYAMPVAGRWPSYAGLYDLIGNVSEVALLPDTNLWGEAPERVFGDSHLLIEGCSLMSHVGRCLWPTHPAPTWHLLASPGKGLRLVRAY